MKQSALLFDEVTFNAKLGQKAKDEGITKAAMNRCELLDFAKQCAREIAERKGLVNADDVQERLIECGFIPSDLGNAAGAIFKGKEWKWTGELAYSNRVSRHRNLIRVWRLKERSI